MQVFRSPNNPIIKPANIKPSRDDFEVMGVFNPAVTRYNDEVILLARVAERPISYEPGAVLVPYYDTESKVVDVVKFRENDPGIDFSDPRLVKTAAGTYLTSLSHLRIAKSKDGKNFEVCNKQAIFPTNKYETFGVEDARITAIDERFYITYVAVSQLGVTTCLASTEDFRDFKRHGIIFCPENKDVVIFPERIGGKYYALHRPASPLFKKNEIWIAESPDLFNWGNHRYLMGSEPGRWDEKKIGAGTVPFRTNAGWLEIYHGADRNNRYCLGAVLFDLIEPWRIIARSQGPVFEPQTEYERSGFFGSVVFACGLLYEQGRLNIYYGAADTSVCYAQISLEEVFRNLNL